MSWNKSIVDPQTLVVGCLLNANHDNLSNIIQIYGYSHSHGCFVKLSTLSNGDRIQSIRQLDWCPKSFNNTHYIAGYLTDETKNNKNDPKLNYNSISIWELNISYNDNLDNITITNDSLVNLKNFLKNELISRIMWNRTGKEVIVLAENEKKYIFKAKEEC